MKVLTPAWSAEGRELSELRILRDAIDISERLNTECEKLRKEGEMLFLNVDFELDRSIVSSVPGDLKHTLRVYRMHSTCR